MSVWLGFIIAVWRAMSIMRAPEIAARNGTCGVIAFGLKGDRETAIKFMDSLDMINIVTHVADARTCVLHPASHTHRQLSEEQLKEAGVAPDLIRLSVGIEDVEDILDDIKQALDQI